MSRGLGVWVWKCMSPDRLTTLRHVSTPTMKGQKGSMERYSGDPGLYYWFRGEAQGLVVIVICSRFVVIVLQGFMHGNLII